MVIRIMHLRHADTAWLVRWPALANATKYD
jgi:hypothetical protein